MKEIEPKKVGAIKEASPYQLVLNDGVNNLYSEDFEANGKKGAVAMFAGSRAAVIDTRAYEILEKECLGNITRLNRYLRTILNFELLYSDNPYRHEDRTKKEREILEILERNGYFK